MYNLRTSNWRIGTIFLEYTEAGVSILKWEKSIPGIFDLRGFGSAATI